MRAALWLRIAAGIAALLAIGHSLGGPWTPATDIDAANTVKMMRTVHFDVAGSSRSYLDFYEGFGWILGVYLAAQAILFWQLAALPREFSHRLLPPVAVLGSANLCAGVLCAKYLFWVPSAMSGAIAFALLLCWLSLAAPPKRSKPDDGVPRRQAGKDSASRLRM